MRVIALDLSKSCTGWAFFKPGDERAMLGHFSLGGVYSSNGQVFAKLHTKLSELHQTFGFERMVVEQKINPQNLNAVTSYQTLALMGGLESHAESFAAILSLIYRATNVSTWRTEFLGRDEIAGLRRKVKADEARTGKKTGASDALKAGVMLRARELGHEPRKNDEADAFGILDNDLLTSGITPPWRSAEVLRPMAVVS